VARPWKIVDLDPNENLKICLRKIALTRYQETFSYEQGTMKGEDLEALHDMRVSARRLRAILRIFRECFPNKKLRKQDERLQNLIRSLGAVRELDVFIELLEAKRGLLTQREGRIMDLLLARERNSRIALRKRLSSELRSLRRAHHAEAFGQFLKGSL
jgi:CHAD domain-containing protein